MAKGKRGVKLCTNALFKLAHFFFPGAPNWSKCARMRDGLLLGFVLLLFCGVCYAYLLFWIFYSPPPFFFILFLSVFAMGAYRAAFTGRRNLGSYFRGLFFFHFFPVRGKWAARDSPSFCVEWRAITPFSVSPRPIELIRGEKPRRSRNCFSDFEIITKCENLRGAAESWVRRTKSSETMLRRTHQRLSGSRT